MYGKNLGYWCKHGDILVKIIEEINDDSDFSSCEDNEYESDKEQTQEKDKFNVRINYQ
jgi:hypothetical protein